MGKSKETVELLQCQCSSLEHMAVVSYSDDDEDVILSVHLAELPFWKRAVNAVKYMFGYRCCYGDFDEILLRCEDADKLQSVVDHLRMTTKKSE